jgi:microsomal dipeptidase-like Zn-dependent dipeptidase
MRGFPVEVRPEAAAIHEAALVVDLHNDVLTKLTHMPGYDFTREHAPATFYNPLRLDLDLPRIKRGGIDALGCLMFAGFRFDKSATASGGSSPARASSPPTIPTRSRWRARRMTSARRTPRASSPCSSASRAATRSTTTSRAAWRGSPRRGVRFLGPLWERDSRAGTSVPHAGRARPRPDRARAWAGARLQRGGPAARRRAREQEDLLGT